MVKQTVYCVQEVDMNDYSLRLVFVETLLSDGGKLTTEGVIVLSHLLASDLLEPEPTYVLQSTDEEAGVTALNLIVSFGCTSLHSDEGGEFMVSGVLETVEAILKQPAEERKTRQMLVVSGKDLLVSLARRIARDRLDGADVLPNAFDIGCAIVFEFFTDPAENSVDLIPNPN